MSAERQGRNLIIFFVSGDEHSETASSAPQNSRGLITQKVFFSSSILSESVAVASYGSPRSSFLIKFGKKGGPFY